MLQPTAVSIVIPVYNELAQLPELVKRLAHSLKNYRYELIFVDDHSTDGTAAYLQDLKAQNRGQVQVIKKVGRQGKTTALKQGFAHARYDVFAMIDADLSYPPEQLPKMIVELKSAEIVVAHRTSYNGMNFIKKLLCQWFRFFGKMIFGMDYDVLAGMKVFSKKVYRSIPIHPNRWTFDLEFLFYAFHHRYRIVSVSVDYHSRQQKGRKRKLLSTMLELVRMMIVLKFSPLKPLSIPAFNDQTMRGAGILYKGKSFITHTSLDHDHGAFYTISWPQIFALLLVLFALGFALGMGLQWLLMVIVSIISIFYFTDLLFQSYLIWKTYSKNPQIEINTQELDLHKNRKWPSYTIFCPLYKEAAVIPQFVQAMQQLDYPKDKLQIQLLLEEDDMESILAVQHMQLPKYFEVIVVPNSEPKTKPKACNYGLSYATGEYAVIYDAEDVPDPAQLKKAVLTFEKLNNDQVVCVQAKLNFYNPFQNLLTRLFTVEYSLWFDLILVGMQAVNAPIPLGGTSNHFRTADLHKLAGWDPFNVTEDCDLGIRLIKQGYRTVIINSTTMEEANSRFGNWLRQRSRWIKGYIQTYLVHMRRPGEFKSDFKNPQILLFQLVVGGKILSLFINPFMWTLTIAYFGIGGQVAEFIESIYLPWVFYIAALSLVFGNFFYLYNYMVGCAKRKQWELVKVVYIVPFYWLMMSVSAWMALYQLIFRPHYWEKTVHGLHLQHQSGKVSVSSGGLSA